LEFPGNHGLHGRPTLMNSVETFADVGVIVQRGADWWRDQGAGDSVGRKFFAVSWHVERPDVYCVPMGTTVRELIDLAAAFADARVPSGTPLAVLDLAGNVVLANSEAAALMGTPADTPALAPSHRWTPQFTTLPRLARHAVARARKEHG
jgi:hypothetical protein